jgi:hypothetical protein
MFDPNNITVGGILLIAVVFGLTEFLKDNLAWEGKKVTVLAATLGVALYGLFELQVLLPEQYTQIYELVVKSITFGLTASGYYKFVEKRLPKDGGIEIS